MANEKHLYMTFRGRWSAANNQQDRWQTGIRMAGVFGSIDPVGILPNNWAVAPANSNRTDTDGYVETNWLVNGPIGSSFSPDDWLQDQAKPAWTALITSMSSKWPNASILEEVRLYPIGPDGKVLETVQGKCVARYVYNNGQAGATSGGILPTQNTVAVTFSTSRSGRRGKGRMYPPGVPTGDLETDGRFKSTSATAMAGAYDNFLDDLKVRGPGQDMSIAAAVIGKPWTNYAVINAAGVGNRVDTQRRRRNGYTEVYY